MAKKRRSQGMDTHRRSVVFPSSMLNALEKLASRNHTTVSDLIRRAVDEMLGIQSNVDDIQRITGIIEQALAIQLKSQSNRLAALINRLTIISAAAYFTNITAVADLLDRDRYSSFEKIERMARRKALAYANSKNGEGLREFLDDEQIKRMQYDLVGKKLPENDGRKKIKLEDFDPLTDDPRDLDDDD
ncbi:hypothetical protein [Ethanoligenens sp.]|uniref:hypothetical protein n=1 Tax=Ethanoligenens sp. TaxID=2099655 RepID=UPI0039EA76F9